MNKILVFLLTLFFIAGCARETPQVVEVAKYGDISELEALLASGVDNYDLNGWALREASKKDDFDMVKALVNAGDNVNGKSSLTNFNGNSFFAKATPLIIATEKGNTKIVRFLIESGADLNDFAVEYETRWIVQKRQFRVKGVFSPLMIAAKQNNLEIANILLEAGANIDAQNKLGETALMAAVSFGNVDIATLLVRSGADVNATKHDLTTALMIAARNGNIEITSLLLDAGADVNIGLGSGDTALSLAVAYSKNTSIIKALIEKGAVVDQKNKEGQTLISLAVWSNNQTNVKVLIDRGADVNEKDKEDRTLLDRSIGGFYYNKEIPILLIESGADVNQGDPLTLAAHHGNSELVSLLVKHGLNVNKKIITKDKYTNKSTALHFAAIKGHEETLQILLETGADIDAQSQNGDTALILAAMNGYSRVVKVLINYGADLNIMNNDHYTALKIARKNSRGSVIELLTQAGAKE